MDSPIVTQLFRQLFRQQHPACRSRRNLAVLSTALQYGRGRIQQLQQQQRLQHEQRRCFASRPSTRGGKQQVAKNNDSDWQQRTELFSFDMSEEYKTYPLVTANELKSRKERPRKVKMLMRDFIDGVYLCLTRASCA